MKTIGILLLVLLLNGISHEAAATAQAEKNVLKPCFPLVASPASEEDTYAFQNILNSLHVGMDIFLYVSHDPKLRKYGGAISFRCEVDNHEVYETDENWTIYDPDLIHGDAARDFVFAHEIAHHMSGDTTSGRPRSKELELRADYNGAEYLLSMGWTGARLLHALDLLNLPQGPQPGYPTLEERKATVKAAAHPPGPAPPTNLQATLVAMQPDTYEVPWSKLMSQSYGGPIQFQSIRTSKFVCAIGTPDPRIPSTHHFAFFDNCELGSGAFFDLEISEGGSGYWITQNEKPCPEYSVNCLYAMESDGLRLQFWNQDLAADQFGWEKELGEQELFDFEASSPSEGLVRIRARKGGYVFVDPKTAQLQSGGSLKQAAEFKVLFELE